jgi:hypothetical protein
MEEGSLPKQNKMRDLVCAGLNEIISQGLIDLSSLNDVVGATRCRILGKDTKISWRGIGHGEIRITVWWGIKAGCEDSSATMPLNRDLRDAVDVCCSAWLERKDGLWLQGEGGDYLFDTYCARSAERELMAIPVIQPNGYQKEGRFYK